MSSIPRVMIIAGSDSSGGAGVQADIKTVSMLGGYAMTAITAITMQNTQGVESVHALPLNDIQRQFELVQEDIGIDIIKTGMLHNAEVIDYAAHAVANANVPAVIDPVMVATSGDALLESDAIEIMKDTLIPQAYVLTPNIPEAELLTGLTIDSHAAMEQVAEKLLGLGARHVLLKGGHMQEDTVHDLLVGEGIKEWYGSPRIHTHHTHGTGCTLASALATVLAKGLEIEEAVEQARHYVHQAIATAPGFGKGHGPLNHLHPLERQ